MKIIARPSCTGKTKELIEYAIETNIPILCLTQSKAKSITEKAQAYFNSVVPICTLKDIVNTVIPAVLIDDAEKALNELLMDLSDYETCVAGLSITI